MKKISIEDGCLVLREGDGKLFRSYHTLDIKGLDGGLDVGYIELIIDGSIEVNNIFNPNPEKLDL